MHSQIKCNCSIWKEKDWIVTRFRKFLFSKISTEKRELANNTKTNQRRDLLGLRVCWMFLHRNWRDLSFPTDHRGHGLFGPPHMKKIWLCCFLEELAEVLLVDLAGVAESSLWCLLVGITQLLLAELARVALPFTLSVPTLLIWIFEFDFSTTLKLLRSLSLLSSWGEATKS